MSGKSKRLPAFFYRLPSGREPVREWLKTFPATDRHTIGEDIKDVEFAWRAARVIFAVEHGCMVLLHGFVKKTQATPQADLDLARRRMRDLA